MPLTVTPGGRRQRGRNGTNSSPSIKRYPDPKEIESPSLYTTLSPRMAPVPVTPTKDIQMPTIVPRTTSPSLRSNEPSWEDLDEGFFGSANKARRNKGQSYSTSNSSYEEDEMPMDELMAITKKESQDSMKPRRVEPESPVTSSSQNNVNKMIIALSSNPHTRPNGLSLEERMLWDTIQSTIMNVSKRMKSDSSSGVSIRETELEMKLSEAESKIEQLDKKLLQSQQKPVLPASHSDKDVEKVDLAKELQEAKEQLKAQESEHDAELRAIQRVLAEITAEREEENHILNETVATLSKKVETLESEKMAMLQKQRSLPPPPPPPTRDHLPQKDPALEQELQKLKETVKALESENASAKKETQRKARHASLLERDYKVLKVQLKKLEDEKREKSSEKKDGPKLEALQAELEKTKESNQKLQSELDAAIRERRARRKPIGSMTPPRPEMTSHNDMDSVASSMSAEDVESLQKNLSETTSSLENAKKIIASLENANGSMAVELRAKLKVKEDELEAVQKESAERKRRLDSLATELRDLQKQHDDVKRLESESKAQVIRHKALMGLLEKSVSGLQAASAIHEVSTATGQPDQSNVEQISEILNDAMIAIRTALELSEQYVDEYYDDETTVASTHFEVNSEVGRQVDAMIKNDREALASQLRDELELKRVAVRRLEEALQKQNEEIRRLRSEPKNSGDNEELMEEVKTLRERCSRNIELLAKKEQELSVLRASLKVDDSDGGYISDDASEADDNDNDNSTFTPNSVSGYGPEKTEALAALIAAGGNMPEQDSDFQKEWLQAKTEKEAALAELKSERDSLANAKLIISSLEKANKSMTEDLRARLQESNTAIATLLDRSNEQEKNSNTLREEVEKLRKEKDRLEFQLQKGTPEFDKDSLPISEEKKENEAEI